MNWKRTLGWSLLIFFAALVVGLSLGTGLLSTIGVFASSTTLYCFFLRPIERNRIRHFVIAFLLVEAMDWIVPVALGAPISHMLDNWDSSLRHLGAGLLGFTIARLSSNNSFKPKPLRGSA